MNINDSNKPQDFIDDAIVDTTATVVTETPQEAPASRLSEFAKTGTAAKLSGTFNETAGKLKRKFGEMTNDEALKEAGLNQELLGKIHRLVGTIREIRSGTAQKIETKKVEGQKIIRKHGAKLLDVAYELAEDLKKLILK